MKLKTFLSWLPDKYTCTCMWKLRLSFLVTWKSSPRKFSKLIFDSLRKLSHTGYKNAWHFHVFNNMPKIGMIFKKYILSWWWQSSNQYLFPMMHQCHADFFYTGNYYVRKRNYFHLDYFVSFMRHLDLNCLVLSEWKATMFTGIST